MRFRDTRPTVYKRTPSAEDRSYTASTPLRLSPFKPDGRSVREGVAAADIMQPLHNRASRRAAGNIRRPRRLGGVAPITKPWHREEESSAA